MAFGVVMGVLAAEVAPECTESRFYYQSHSRDRIAGRPPSGGWGSTSRVSFGDVQVTPAEVQTVTVVVVDYVFLTGAKNKTGNGGQTALDLPVLASDVPVGLTDPVEIPLVGVALGQQHLEVLGVDPGWPGVVRQGHQDDGLTVVVESEDRLTPVNKC